MAFHIIYLFVFILNKIPACVDETKAKFKRIDKTQCTAVLNATGCSITGFIYDKRKREYTYLKN